MTWSVLVGTLYLNPEKLNKRRLKYWPSGIVINRLLICVKRNLCNYLPLKSVKSQTVCRIIFIEDIDHFARCENTWWRACVRSRCYGNIARQVVERVLHDATLKKLLQSLQKVEPDSTLWSDWCNLSRNDFDHCISCYTVQWSVQLVSQRRSETSSMKNCTV